MARGFRCLKNDVQIGLRYRPCRPLKLPSWDFLVIMQLPKYSLAHPTTIVHGYQQQHYPHDYVDDAGGGSDDVVVAGIGIGGGAGADI